MPVTNASLCYKCMPSKCKWLLHVWTRFYVHIFGSISRYLGLCTVCRLNVQLTGLYILDPFDCTRYHVCYDVDMHNGIYQCPTGYIFNIKLHLCEKVPSTPLNCGKIDCSKSKNQILLYPTNSAYYAFCIDYESYSWGAYGSIIPMMFKCEFEQFETYNQTMGYCTFTCKAKGNFQDPANCQRYYVCSAAGAVGDLISCPQNFVFDGTGCTMDETKCEYPPPRKAFDTTTTQTPDMAPVPPMGPDGPIIIP